MRSLGLLALAVCIAFVTVHGAVTQTLPVEDATVRNGIYSNNNYGFDPTAYIKSSNEPDFTRWYYIKFPINNLVPLGNSRVVIKLFGYYQGTGFPLTVACWSVPSDTWSQNTITWNNKPSPGAILSSAQVGNQILWYEWDVTTNVREQINAGEPLASFVFRASNITQDIVLINSLEADVNQPLLIVLPPAPTQSVVNPTDDAYVRGGAYQNTNFGLLAELIVREGSTNSGTRRSYLKFPLNNLATITNTQKVLLRVFGYFQGTGTSVIDCHTSTNINWNQNTVTWATRPAISASYIAQANAANTAAWVEFDVTTYVLGRQQAGAASVTFALVADSIDTELNIFNSLEADTNQPQLAITPLSPTVNSVNALEDASVRGGNYCNQNYALDATAYVRNGFNADNTWQYYVKFPLSNLSPITGGRRVVIRLFGYYEGTTLSVAANSVDDNSWSQGTITFCNKPNPTGVLTTTPVNHPIAWYQFDVTNYVISRKALGLATISFAFTGTTQTNDRMLINTVESDVNRPTLTIIQN
jgi:hypothetical protein